MISIFLHCSAAWAFLAMGFAAMKMIIGRQNFMDHFCEMDPLFVVLFQDCRMDFPVDGCEYVMCPLVLGLYVISQRRPVLLKS
jgi:hypothetical protein